MGITSFSAQRGFGQVKLAGKATVSQERHRLPPRAGSGSETNEPSRTGVRFMGFSNLTRSLPDRPNHPPFL